MPAPHLSPKPDAIQAHLDHITKRWNELSQDVVFEIVYLTAEDRAKVKHVARYRPDQIQEAAENVAGMNRHKLNAYVVVNPIYANATIDPGKRAAAEHIVASFFHWADADSQEAADNIRAFAGPQPTFNVMTGTTPSPRPHVYWELEEPTRNLEAWTQTQRAIAASLKTDPAVIDAPRIMRLAGTVNWPKPQKLEKGYQAEVTGLHIHDPENRPPVSSERMARAFSAAPANTTPTQGMFATNQTDFDNKTRDDYADALRRARTDGEKHTGVRDLAASLAGQGVKYELAQAIVESACPVWDENVEDLLRSAYEKFFRQPPEINTEPDRPQTETPQGLEWFAEIEPSTTDSYHVKNLLGQNALSVVYGPSNSGKTFFVIDLAFHAAAGQPWRGRRVTPSAVLYLAAEGGRGVANRIVALRDETKAGPIPFALRRAGMDLLKETADLQAVYDLAQAVKANAPNRPLLIVIDTLSRVMAGGDENSAADMTALIKNIDQLRELTGAHIMLVHHTGKDAARGARGHSSLRAATDTEIEIQSEDETRAAMVTKQRDYSGGEVFGFNLKSVKLGTDQDGDEITSCIVVPEDTDDMPNRRRVARGRNQNIILETFDQMIGEGMGQPNPGGLGMPEGGKFWAVDLQELRRQSELKMPSKNSAKLFRQAWEAISAPGDVFCTAQGLAWREDRQR